MTEGFTDDRLLGGRVVLRQPVTGYRAAIDPVLLAAAVRAAPGARVLDAGCGTGATMFCLAARCPDVTVTGLERSTASAALGRAGIDLNSLVGRAVIVEGDLAKPPDMGAAFDIVMTNPPFGADGTPPPDPGRAVAHQEGDLDLAAWVRACLNRLKPKGRLVMIHRADRLSEVLSALRGRGAGDIRILPIYPKAGEAARRVIVDAGKGRRSPDTLLPGLVLHEPSGGFTPAAEAVLRDGAALMG
ncbi:MAG: methyltransferase domain-containing protein [Rhodospirillaceae bacterium]|nr:MAG: methyltransferase domain-containing protein [Rhodospirillaceae bacterium]